MQLCSILRKSTGWGAARLLGGDLFDFWVKSFYVGFFGVSHVHIRQRSATATILTGRRSAQPGTSGRPVSRCPTSNTVVFRAAEGRRTGGFRLRLCAIGAVSPWALREAEILPQARHRLPRAGRLRLCIFALRLRWSSSARY